MRRAIHQVSTPHRSRDDAGDAMSAFTRPDMARQLGVEALWIDLENRVHMVVTNIAGIETLSEAQLQPGQRLVWLP